MTLFEYIYVAVSIVLSLGVVRLLDTLPHALKADRRDRLHIAWIATLLLVHSFYWWFGWSYRSYEGWNYATFLLVLVQPGILYSLSRVLASDDPRDVASWRQHFDQISRRLFLLMAAYVVGISILAWVMAGWVGTSFRVGQAISVAVLVFAALKRNRQLNEWVTWLQLAGFVYAAIGFAWRPGPLSPSP